MSFTTDNNKENVVKDSQAGAAEKSPLRRLAEERAERIRYAEEYRRKLEAEKAPVAPKKTKAAEQKEQAKLEKIEREKAEIQEKLEAERLDSERRISLIAEKVEKINEIAMSDEAKAPALTEATAEASENPPTPEAKETAAPVAELIHIPVQSFTVPCIVTRRVPAPAPAVSAASPITRVNKTAPTVRTINVTDQFRNSDLAKPVLSYGIPVTAGGWEHEINDDEPVVAAAPANEAAPAAAPAFVIIPASVPGGVMAVPVANTAAPAAAPAVAPVAIPVAAPAAVPTAAGGVVYYAPAVAEQPMPAAPATVNAYPFQVSEAINPTFVVSEAPVQLESDSPISVEEKIIPVGVPGAAAPAAPAASTAVGTPALDMHEPCYDAVEGLSLNYGEQYEDPKLGDERAPALAAADNFETAQLEDEHIRFLKQSNKLDKNIRNRISDGKPYDSESTVDYTNPKKIKRAAKKSASLIEARMNYDLAIGKSELAIEMLKFGDPRFDDKREQKKTRQKIEKFRCSIAKAKKLEKKATKRYYKVLAKEVKKPASLRDEKKITELKGIIFRLESLLREREMLDARLVTLYMGAENKAGGKIRLAAERKRYKTAKKIRRSLVSYDMRLEKSGAPDSFKTKLRHLFNTKIISKSTLVYSKFMLKKLRPKGAAKSELKRDIKNAKRSLAHVEENIHRMMKKVNKFARARKRRKTFLIILLLLVIIGAGAFAVYYMMLNGGLAAAAFASLI